MTKKVKPLTARQYEVMEALCRLGCTKLVAAELDSPKQAVDDVIRRVMRVTGARTRLHAALAFDRERRVTFHGAAANSVFALADSAG